jgi:uncharacterized membrane protein
MEGESHSEVIDAVLDVIEYAAVAIEVLAVAIILIGITWATWVFANRFRDPDVDTNEYAAYRIRLGKTLLLGLEILVAADVVRTVALEPTLENVGILGLLVLIRTFLSWSLTVEIENRWPWQRSVDGRVSTGGTTESREI